MLVIVCCEHKHRLLRAYHSFAPMLRALCCGLTTSLLCGCNSDQASIYANNDAAERIIFHLGINLK